MDRTDDSYTLKCCGISCLKKKKMINDDEFSSTSMISNTLQNPVLYSGKLPQPLLPGYGVEVSGTPSKECERFSINFMCENSIDSNISLHFNPRLEENYVVRNSKRNGKWENEEITSHIRLNLPRNVKFELIFFISIQEFLISVNKQHFCEFKFRTPITNVQFLHIEGDLNIENVEIKEYLYYPNNDDVYKPLPFSNIYDGKTKLRNPFIGYLQNGFKNGWQIEIYGKVKILPSDFYINLQDGYYMFPHPCIPLHINPRFANNNKKDALIFNSWKEGVWGTEERSAGFHFAPSKPFHLVIQLDLNRDVFIIWLNGQLEREFLIRNLHDITSINTVKIQGDLFIYAVFLKKTLTNMLNYCDIDI